MLDLAITGAIYVATIAALIGVNLWALRTMFSSTQVQLSPFEILGAANDGSRGKAMAVMLIAQVNEAARQLEAARSLLSSGQATGVGPLMQGSAGTDIPFPPQLFEVNTPELQIGNVDVGKLLGWLQKIVGDSRSVDFSVLPYKENGVDVVAVSGELSALGERPIYIRAIPDNELRIIDAIADELFHRSFVTSVPELSRSKAGETKALRDILNKLADFERRSTFDTVTTKEFGDLEADAKNISESIDKWAPALVVAARIAEGQENFPSAIERYRAARKLTKAGEALATALDAKIDELTKKNAVQQSINAASTGAAQSAEDLIKIMRMSNAVQALLDEIGASASELAEVEISIVGGNLPAQFWPHATPDKRLETSDVLSEYTGTLASVLWTFLPKAKLDVIPVAGSNVDSAAIVAALEEALKKSPKVLLVPFGNWVDDPNDPAWLALKKLTMQDTLVVLPSGNEPKIQNKVMDAEKTADDFLILAASDSASNPAAYSADSSLWAPGDAIPVLTTEQSQISVRSGTAYSAAFGAGVAAVLRSEFPDKSARKLIEVLKATATIKKSVPIINLANARSALAAGK